VLLVLVPVAILVWLRFGVADHLEAIENIPEPVIMEAETRQVYDQTAVMLSLDWGEPDSVSAPRWSGLVTEISVATGDTITSGTAVMAIDGVARVAEATARPFYRRLGRGDKGEDVTILQELLGSMGLLSEEPDGVYGTGTAKAVKAWSTDLGVINPDGIFDPGWIIWLPTPSFRIGQIDASVGFDAPTPGAAFMRGPRLLDAVTIRDLDGNAIDLRGDWILIVDESTFDMTDGALDPVELGALAQSVDPGVDQVTATVRRSTPLEVLRLPATAVVSNVYGATCVWLESGEGYEARAVVVGSGLAGQVDIEQGVKASDLVLVNPADVLTDPTCPSN
jgi:peptidoglycan hydrolase-like protein with peptidoglycan-binding domain